MRSQSTANSAQHANTQFDFAVVGGGIVGKASALAMAQLGYSVIQIAPDLLQTITLVPSFGQRIYALSPSTKRLLSELNVWDGLDQTRIQAISDMRIYGDHGQKHDQLHFSAFEAGRPELAWIAESDLIEATLTQAIRFSKNLQSIEASVDEVRFEPNTSPTLSLSNGQTIQAKLVIAADGANSPLRQSVGIEIDQHSYDQHAVVANFTCSIAHRETAYQWFLPNGEILAMLPLPQQQVSMVWSTQNEHAKHLLQLDSQAWSNQFALEVHDQLGELQLQSTPASFPLRRIKAHRLIGPDYDPKLILVGDSAHVMHPLAGQGLNLGLRDVASLLHIMKNKESYREVDDRILLRRYEREREGDTASLLWLTDRLKKLFSAQSPIEKGFRNWGLRIVNRSHIIKRQLIERALGEQPHG
ncbi:MAG: ubiquinone biosynthesis protein UbiH [Betaproteobacteria bacterium]|nr:ubiquinone biosynthesis protein UbiH [Betaproteobacteria bacterium]